jgi:hypothetical protein
MQIKDLERDKDGKGNIVCACKDFFCGGSKKRGEEDRMCLVYPSPLDKNKVIVPLDWQGIFTKEMLDCP